jgi:hypothetical protein
MSKAEEINVKQALKMYAEVLKIMADFLASIGKFEKEHPEFPSLFSPEAKSFWSDILGPKLFKELNEDQVILLMRIVYRLVNLPDIWTRPAEEKIKLAENLTHYTKEILKICGES